MRITWWIAGGAAVAVVAAVALVMFRPGRVDDRYASPEHPVVSPSGRFQAEVVPGPVQNGVETLYASIRNLQTGEVEFEDDYAYSTRHGVGVTWLSNADQLWLLSSDVGTTHVDRTASGQWTKTAITPETRGEIPAEVAAYYD